MKCTIYDKLKTNYYKVENCHLNFNIKIINVYMFITA